MSNKVQRTRFSRGLAIGLVFGAMTVPSLAAQAMPHFSDLTAGWRASREGFWSSCDRPYRPPSPRHVAAGLLYIDGVRFVISVDRPLAEIARAFRKCGYRVKVAGHGSDRCLQIMGCPKVRWTPRACDVELKRTFNGLEIHLGETLAHDRRGRWW